MKIPRTMAQMSVPSNEMVVKEIPRASWYERNSMLLGTQWSRWGLDQKSSGQLVHSVESKKYSKVKGTVK